MKSVLALTLVAALLASNAAPASAQAVRATVARAPGALVAGEHRGLERYGRHEYRRPSYDSARVWIPGCYELVTERVWIPGCRERVWIEPVFELRTDICGITVRVQVSPGHWSLVERPGHWETRSRRVWRPGYWQVRGGHR